MVTLQLQEGEMSGQMGGVDTIRFLNQFSVGRGDYTKERDKWLADISLDDAIAQIKAEKINTLRGT
ncbi:MAG: hypothetical protein HY881_22780 [Deltaproteobacteria bacterium]|nr:hypothetical protein [Deltaproteobacteria bacterium]